METVTLDDIAESFVKLALAVGQHDADYVDAYFGPQEWRDEAESEALTLDQIHSAAVELAQELDGIPVSSADAMASHRQEWLAKTLGALTARVDFLRGERLGFDPRTDGKAS